MEPKQELGAPSWRKKRRDSRETMLTGLLWLFSYAQQDHLPETALPTVGWALPRQSLIKEMPCTLAYRPA